MLVSSCCLQLMWFQSLDRAYKRSDKQLEPMSIYSVVFQSLDRAYKRSDG